MYPPQVLPVEGAVRVLQQLLHNIYVYIYISICYNAECTIS